MTRIINIETEQEYHDIYYNNKNFIICKEDENRPIKAGDTIIAQYGEGECALTCSAVETEAESAGLKKGYRALTLKSVENGQ